MAIYTSESTRQQLEQPLEVFTSPRKMGLGLVFYAAVGGLLVYMGYSNHSTSSMAIASLIMLVAIAALVNQWRYVKRPMLVLSKEGIAIQTRKSGFARWQDVTENVWHQHRYSFITTNAFVTLRDRTRAKPYHINVKWLAMSSDEYLRMCDLYASEARGGHA